jgi:hypothetical protein
VSAIRLAAHLERLARAIRVAEMAVRLASQAPAPDAATARTEALRCRLVGALEGRGYPDLAVTVLLDVGAPIEALRQYALGAPGLPGSLLRALGVPPAQGDA